MLRFKNFSKGYSGVPVIQVPDLEFIPGVYWIRGENGSGKSTLFKSLAGIHPFDGTIVFSDQTDLQKNPLEFRKRVSYSEAEPLFPGFLTANDLVEFVATTRNSSQEKKSAVIQRLGLDQFLHKRCEAYSSGMLKKLSLALAFIGEPKVIILDEPLITLDDRTRDILLGMISEADAQKDKVILLSSHQTLDVPGITIAKKFRIADKLLAEE